MKRILLHLFVFSFINTIHAEIHSDVYSSLTGQDVSTRKGCIAPGTARFLDVSHRLLIRNKTFRKFYLPCPQVLVGSHVRGWALIAKGICC